MTRLYAYDAVEDEEVVWNTKDEYPQFYDWKFQPSKKPFHLQRMVLKDYRLLEIDSEWYALTFLRMTLDGYAADYTFAYGTTCPFIEDKKWYAKELAGRPDVCASIFEEGGYIIASTLVYPMFKEDLE